MEISESSLGQSSRALIELKWELTQQMSLRANHPARPNKFMATINIVLNNNFQIYFVCLSGMLFLFNYFSIQGL